MQGAEDRTSKSAALMRKLMAVRPVAAAMPKWGAGELVDVGPEQLALGRLARSGRCVPNPCRGSLRRVGRKRSTLYPTDRRRQGATVA